jgi:hypothetical protein
MASTLKVNEIQHTGGNSAMTIDSAGKVTVEQNVFNRNNSVVLRGFYLNTNTNTTTSSTTLTNWSEMNSASKGFKPVGVANGVTQSSGVFSFAVTGVYRVSWTIHAATISSDSRWIQADMRYTPNGGSGSQGDTYNYMQVTSSNNTYTSFMREKYWNIAHTGDTIECRINSDNTITIRGSTEQNGGDTWIFFEKVAEAV